MALLDFEQGSRFDGAFEVKVKFCLRQRNDKCAGLRIGEQAHEIRL
jgi:hypothetical protein